MKKTFAVIGLGRFGSHVAITLEQLGQTVLAFDKNETSVEAVMEYVTHARALDSTDKDALEEGGVTKCDIAIVCIGENCANNFLTVLNLKELGVKTIVAKAKTAKEGLILEKIGATKVIYPERESAIRLANQLTSSDILEFIEVSPDYQTSEIEAPAAFVGNTIEALNTVKVYRVLVLALRRKGKTIIIPSAREVVKEGDIVVVVGQTKDVVHFVKQFTSSKKV